MSDWTRKSEDVNEELDNLLAELDELRRLETTLLEVEKTNPNRYESKHLEAINRFRGI